MRRAWQTRDLFARHCPFCAERLLTSLRAIEPACITHLEGSTIIVESTSDIANEVEALSQDLMKRFGHLEGKVEGADCPSCADKIQRALVRETGVQQVEFHFVSKRLLVEYDAEKTCPDTLRATVRSLGHDLVEEREKPAPSSCCCGGSACAAAPILPESSSFGEKVRHFFTEKSRRPLLVAGGMVLLAYALTLVVPAAEAWFFGVAALVAGLPVFRKAWRDVAAREPFTIQTLMAIAALGAVAIGAAEEALMVVFLFALGEFLEALAASRARKSIASLLDIAPREAILCIDEQRETVPAETLRPKDLIEVRAGARIPTDGEVVAGTSHVDESLLTGESVPVLKLLGAMVSAGTLNKEGCLLVRVTRTVADNTLSRIIRMVEEAQENRAPIARFIDRFARWYTPGIFAAALAVATLPPLLFSDAGWGTWLYRALGLLLIGCPCALVLSVPTAITAAIASGARRGLLIKGGASLEHIGRVATIAFDKTGTLTEGRPEVTDVLPASGLTPGEVVSLAVAVEAGSDHPLAEAVRRHAHASPVPRIASSDHKTVAGEGVYAKIGEKTLGVVAPRFAPASHGETLRSLEAQGKTVVAVMEGSSLLGLMAFRDELRSDSKEALAVLQRQGVRSVMLTGDNRRVAESLARELGIDCEPELLPEMKLQHIENLKEKGMTAMVGDGINDAPALAAAHVGIAMGRGADVAIETADAVLSHPSLTSVARLVSLSRDTMAVVRQNILIALGLKGAILVTTLMGFTGLWLAVMADTGATVLVTLNALRLLAAGKPEGG